MLLGGAKFQIMLSSVTANKVVTHYILLKGKYHADNKIGSTMITGTFNLVW